MFVSNLLKNISMVELEGMFFRAGRIVDIFIPVEKGSREGRGFAFGCFDKKREAEKAVDLVVGRSWGGWKKQANIAHYSSKGEMGKAADKPRTSGDGATELPYKLFWAQ